jgi:hypothetical protein
MLRAEKTRKTYHQNLYENTSIQDRRGKKELRRKDINTFLPTSLGITYEKNEFGVDLSRFQNSR